ncbi:MAG: hypothetical protein ACRC4O_04955 [Giesbergeria sp.]
MAGRPSELTLKRQETACDLIRRGLPLAAVAAGIGVSYATFKSWRTRGARPDASKEHAAFLAATKAAESDLEVSCLANILAAGLDPKTWVANAWVLERRWPDRYAGPLVKVRAKAAKQGELSAMKAAPPPPDVAAIVRYLAETRPELLRDALASVEPKEEVRQ